MRICVQGIWHLGAVTAACLASVGHEVVGLDFDQATIDALSKGDITPARYVTAIICEHGIAREPYTESLKGLAAKTSLASV